MPFSKSRIFFFCCLSFILGTGAASFLPAHWLASELIWFGGAVAGAALTALFWRSGKIKLSGLIALFLFLGIWRYCLALPVVSPGRIEYYNGREIVFTGRISNDPEQRENQQRLEVETEALAGGKQPVKGKVLLVAGLYPVYKYGEKIKARCDLKTPEPFADFAYDRYLAKYDIYSLCYYPWVESLGENDKNFFLKFQQAILYLKNLARAKIKQGLPEPEAGLGRAIILGDQQAIAGDLKNDFSRSGLSHLMAISGMNISLAAALAMSLFLTLGLARPKAFYAASVIIFVYVLLVGLPASAVRAGIMGFLMLWAMQIGRLNKITNSLVLAASLMLLINPRLLRDDVGFQLSFLAVLGIIYVFPILSFFQEKLLAYFENYPSLFKKFFSGAGEALNLTIAAQVFTLPLMALNFHQISLVSPLANLLVLWTSSLLMTLLPLGIILSFFLSSFSSLFFLPAFIFLKYLWIVARLTANWPYASLEVGDFPWVYLIIYYLAAGWAVWRLKRRAQVRSKKVSA